MHKPFIDMKYSFDKLIYLAHQTFPSYHERKTFFLFFIVNLKISICDYIKLM